MNELEYINSNLKLNSLETDRTRDIQKRTLRILDIEGPSLDISKVVENSTHLTSEQHRILHTLMNKYKHLFDGTLGTFKTSPVGLEVKKGAVPVTSIPFPVPHILHEQFKLEIERLVRLGVLRRNSDSRWTSPSFIIPKKEDEVRFLMDFRKVNEILVRKPYPIPKILYIMQTLQGFTYATTLDLSMGYYSIRLDKSSQEICTIVTPWGKYSYTRLPMGVMCALDIFQSKMYQLMSYLEYVRTYLDYLLILSMGSFENHIQKLEVVLEQLSNSGLRIKTEKCIFGASEVEYLGYTITREGIKPQSKNVDSIKKLSIPRTVRDVCRILGIVQYYRDLWPRRSHTLAPLTELVSTTNVSSTS